MAVLIYAHSLLLYYLCVNYVRVKEWYIRSSKKSVLYARERCLGVLNAVDVVMFILLSLQNAKTAKEADECFIYRWLVDRLHHKLAFAWVEPVAKAFVIITYTHARNDC